VEKIDYLIWGDPDRQQLLDVVAPAILDAGVLALTVHVGDTDEAIPAPPLLLGHGAELGSVVSVWLDSIDDRGPVEGALPDADGYLVTESVPQRRAGRPEAGAQAPGVTHFTWFPKPQRLTEAEFFHGWHDVHTPSTFELHPRRVEYVRDSAVRALTTGSPRVDALVFERFGTIDDYADPRRLFGSKEALDATTRHLSLFADMESINSRPLFEIAVKDLPG
jgi:hypothetical protein